MLHVSQQHSDRQFTKSWLVQTFEASYGASDPLCKVAKLLGVDSKKAMWRQRMIALWNRELKQFVQHAGEPSLQVSAMHAWQDVQVGFWAAC
jgi:hypothetical protein